MFVSWSPSYKLSVRSSSIFPCRNAIRVYYTHPACSGVDNIRLYLLKRRVAGSMAAPLDRIYVIERHALPDLTSVKFNCSLFDDRAAGFCFVYVSIGRNGGVQEQEHLCLAAHPNSVLPIDGNWTTWTEWGECTVKCGNGKRNRLRTCTNPAPKHGGRFCKGDTVEWKSCHETCTETIPENPLKLPSIDPACACGCIMTSQKGNIVASGRCPGSAVWTIVVKDGEKIRLDFQFFHLYPDRQWVRIRNGDTLTSDLLFSTYGIRPTTSVVSSSNKMLVELMTSFPVNGTLSSVAVFQLNASLPIHAYGFIASYTTAELNGARLSDGSLDGEIIRRSQSSVMDSKVAIVGIAMCVVIVVVVVIFVVFHRLIRKRHHKYAMAASESPSHCARSTPSSAPSSPVHDDVIDMEVPLTGGNTAKKKDSTAGVTASRASSVSSTCSAGLKKLRNRGDSGGSPKPSSRDYTPLPSPYAHNASPEEFLHDANFFKASPILKNCKPRSPKVHPSNKIKHAAQIACPPSPTKHELLTKKRQEKKTQEEERVITGSSGSSTQKRQSPPVSPKSLDTPTPVSESCDKPRSVVSSEATGARPILTGLKTSRSRETIPLSKIREGVKLREKKPGVSASNSNGDAVETTSFIQPVCKPRRPTSLTESYSTDSIGAKPKLRTEQQQDKGVSASEERQTLLPKPDGQSPKSPREEHSKGSTPKSIRSGRSQRTLSPTKSITTPSEIEAPELEYDDFIVDDPFSYFDVEETQKLRWQGVEKLSKTPGNDED